MVKPIPDDLEQRKNQMEGMGEIIPMKFIEPGLVRYSDVGTVFVKKETLDQMAQSFVGKPIFNETHQDITSRDFSSGRADGVIVGVRYNPQDGWFWADAMVWDPDTKQNCRNGYSISCAYDVKKWSDGGGIHNNIPYEREVLDGEYTHMAVVDNPRYEGARVIYNTQGGCMKLAFWRKDKDKPEVRNASEVETDNATLEIDGQQVPLKDAIELWNARKKDEERKNMMPLSEDDEIEVGGQKVSVKNLKDAYLANRKNAEDEDKKRKEKEDEERKNAEEKEKEKKDEEERKNAAAEEEKRKKDEEIKNSKHFENLKNRADSRDGQFATPNSLTTLDERVAEGENRYGQK